MGVLQIDTEVGGDHPQLHTRQKGQQDTGQEKGIQTHAAKIFKTLRRVFPAIKIIMALAELIFDKGGVKIHLMTDKGFIGQEVFQIGEDFFDGRFIPHILVADPRQPGNELGYGPPGVDQGFKGFRFFPVAVQDGADFNDGIILGIQPRGFQIDHHKFAEAQVL